MPIYDRYAKIYDLTGQDEFSKGMLRDVHRVLDELNLSPTSALDIACGTGTMACLLAQEGIEVSGVDQSEQMLTQARAKAKSLGLAIDFRRQDMRSLDLGRTFDLITCFYDSINYMHTDDDLLSVFRSVCSHLSSGGIFMFDANTISALCEIWGDNSFAEDGDEVAYIWDNQYDEYTGLASLTATFFVRRPDLGDNIYEKFVETHVEKGFPIDRTIRLIETSGLKLVRQYAYRTNRPATERDRRVVYVVRKP